MKYRFKQTLLEHLIHFRPLLLKPPSTTFRLRPAPLNPREKLRKQAMAYAQAVRGKRKQALAYILALQKVRKLAFGLSGGNGRQYLAYTLAVQRMKNQALAYKLAVLREGERAQAYSHALQRVKLDDALAAHWKTRKALVHALEVKSLELRRSQEKQPLTRPAAARHPLPRGEG